MTDDVIRKLKAAARPGPPLTPGRRFCFSKNDMRRFNELLVEAFPEIRFFRELSNREALLTSAKPSSIASQWLHDLPHGDYKYVFRGPRWQPEWTLKGDHPHWTTTNVSMPAGFLATGGEIRTRLYRVDDDIEYLDEGRLYTRCSKGDDKQVRIGRKIKRLVAKVATNTRQEVWDINPLRLRFRSDKGSDFWIGHEAREWLLAKPNRFTGVQPTTLTRPFED
jgi:hypothetical protein